jgi:hypothetical protein
MNDVMGERTKANSDTRKRVFVRKRKETEENVEHYSKHGNVYMCVREREAKIL